MHFPARGCAVALEHLVRLAVVSDLLADRVPLDLGLESKGDIAQMANRTTTMADLNWRGWFFTRLHTVDEIALMVVVADVYLRHVRATHVSFDSLWNREETSPLILDPNASVGSFHNTSHLGTPVMQSSTTPLS